MKTQNSFIIIFLLIVNFVFTVPSFSQVQVIAGGSSHSIFLCSNGVPRGSGDNTSYQLVDGTSTSRKTPVTVSGLTGITSVGAGIAHSLFVKNDGTVWACGYNDHGQLGDGTTTDRSIPVQVIGLTGIVAATGGYGHSLFLKNDGTVWTCGYNNAGQLGIGSITSDKLTPVQVPGLTGIVAVAACYFRSLFLKNDGTVWGCGQNDVSQLGDGTTTQRNSPVQAVGLAGITAIAVGERHSLFLKNDGNVWACGLNDAGQLGDGTTVNKTIPVQVNALTGIVAVAGAEQGSFSLFVKNNGTVWSCGKNDAGQLGDGTTTDRSTPVMVSGLSGIISANGGGTHSLFVKNDGTVWSCGYNYSGQLGDSSNVNRSIPVRVKGLCTVLFTTGLELNDEPEEFKLFPNPMSDFAILQTENIFTDATLTIYNTQGQPVKQIKNISGQSLDLHRENLPDGMYFVELIEGEKIIKTGKLIITSN
jgi:alpha-tubulin suppressor-like RCC1 family protein